MVEPVERRGAASLEDVVAYASEFESLLHALERIGKLMRAEVSGELMRL